MPDHSEETTMDDTQLERRLAADLHAVDPPAAVLGLAQRSQRLGSRLRRRRRWSAVALGAAVAVAVPGVVWGVADARREILLPSPAGTPSVAVPSATVAVPSPTAARTSAAGPAGQSFDPLKLAAGPEAQIDYTIGDRWHHADGSVTTIAALTAGVDRAGSNLAVRYGSNLFVVHPSGRDGVGDSYSIGDGPVRLIPGGSTQSVSVRPGPEGAVLVEDEKAFRVLLKDGRWDSYGDFGPSHGYAGAVATRSEVWAVAEKPEGAKPRVVQSHPPTSRGPGPALFPKWTGIVFADAVSDRLVTLDDKDCNYLVDGTSGRSLWSSCEWTFLGVSADGRSVVASRGDQLAVLDVATRTVAYFLGTPVDGATVEPAGFGRDGKVVLDVVVEADDGTTTQALVTCSETTCTRATRWVSGQQYRVVN